MILGTQLSKSRVVVTHLVHVFPRAVSALLRVRQPQPSSDRNGHGIAGEGQVMHHTVTLTSTPTPTPSDKCSTSKFHRQAQVVRVGTRTRKGVTSGREYGRSSELPLPFRGQKTLTLLTRHKIYIRARCSEDVPTGSSNTSPLFRNTPRCCFQSYSSSSTSRSSTPLLSGDEWPLPLLQSYLETTSIASTPCTVDKAGSVTPPEHPATTRLGTEAGGTYTLPP